MLAVRSRSLVSGLAKNELIRPVQRHLKSTGANENPIVQSSKTDDSQGVTDVHGTRTKLPQRKPLAKNFMLGITDKELLRFPEVISRDETDRLAGETAAIRSFFTDTLEPKKLELSECISKDVMDHLKNLGLFGFNVPKKYGGREFSSSELSVASEHEQMSGDVAAVLMTHRLVSEIIAEFGTNYLKDKYLPKMANGSLVAAEAIFESTPTDSQFFGTLAEYDEQDKIWHINGQKSFVINGSNANLFLVLAQVSTLKNTGSMEAGIAIFLVDSNLPGVRVELSQSFGLRGAQQGSVSFNKVAVPEENMIGSVDEAFKISETLLKLNRVKAGIVCGGMLKNIIKETTNYAINTKRHGVFLKDVKSIGDRLAKMVCSTYAIESMTYLTTGLIDEFANQDVDLEAAILKLYSLENLWSHSTSCLDYMGPKCLEAGQLSEIWIRNAAQVYAQNETPDSLRQYIGLIAMQHAGMNIHETIRKDRNPLFHPMHVFNRMFERTSIDSPKLTLHLEAEVHPTLDLAAKNLEQSILRLQTATEVLLGRYGSEIINEPLDVLRVTECITLIYATFASIARASRSYCIGLQHSDYELLIATIIAITNSGRVRLLVKDIIDGAPYTNDVNRSKIAKQLFKSQKYFYEHPLKYNF